MQINFVPADYCKDIIIGAARIDENDDIAGGKTGDQKQMGIPDKEGEVSMCELPKEGIWEVFRLEKTEFANRLANTMKTACNNSNIGYDQGNRLDIIKKGVNSLSKTSCDCSSLVRACLEETTGKKLDNFTTHNAGRVFDRCGLFEKKKVVNLKDLQKDGTTKENKSKYVGLDDTSDKNETKEYALVKKDDKRIFKGDILLKKGQHIAIVVEGPSR